MNSTRQLERKLIAAAAVLDITLPLSQLEFITHYIEHASWVFEAQCTFTVNGYAYNVVKKFAGIEVAPDDKSALSQFFNLLQQGCDYDQWITTNIDTLIKYLTQLDYRE